MSVSLVEEHTARTILCASSVESGKLAALPWMPADVETRRERSASCDRIMSACGVPLSPKTTSARVPRVRLGLSHGPIISKPHGGRVGPARAQPKVGQADRGLRARPPFSMPTICGSVLPRRFGRSRPLFFDGGSDRDPDRARRARCRTGCERSSPDATRAGRVNFSVFSKHAVLLDCC